jgi:enoyl-CoA hydratase/carnithine racemase
MTTQVAWTGEVHHKLTGAIATITLDHGARNVLNPGLMTRLRETILEADQDPGTTGILLTGADEVFCGGLDIAAIQAGADPREFARELVNLLGIFPGLTTPIACVVNGDAVASGASLVAACDFAAAVVGARLGTFEVSVGIWPMIAQVPLVHRIGARAAMENVGSGEPFTAQRAYEVGLVQCVARPGEVHDLVRAWLTNAARAGAAGVNRPSLYELAELPYRHALDASLDKFVALFDGPT